MRRWLLMALVLFALESAPVQANGFGLFRRPAETRSAYYYPSVVYYPVSPAPVYYPAVPMQFVPAQPVVVSPFAVPRAALPSTTAEPPLSPVPRVGGSTSLRVGESFYQVLPGPLSMTKEGEAERCSIAFWNLTRGALALRINSQDYTVAPGRSVTLDLPPTFAWNIAGREAEATRIPAGHSTAEVLIRR